MTERGGDPSLLLLDYEMLREDDRSLVSSQIQTFSIGIATLGLLGALVVHALDTTQAHLPDPALVGAPLIPLALFVYMVTMAPPSIIRSFYGRLLERQLHDHFAQRKMADTASRYDERLRFPSIFELSVGVQRLSRGSTTVRVFVGLLALLVTVIFCGITAVLIYLTDSFAIKLAAIPFYVLTVGVMVWHAVRLNVNGRDYFYAQVEAYESSRQDRLLPRSDAGSGRSLASYLVLPRPADAAKWMFFPVGALISWKGGDSPFEPLRFFTMLVVLEYLLYSARYQINDIRGLSEDARSPQSLSRGRLPSALSDRALAIRASLLVAMVRVYVAVILAFAPSLRLTASIVAAVLLVAGTALAYEWLRSTERAWYSSSQQILSTHSHTLCDNKIPDGKVARAASLLTVFVGSGYVVRIALGLGFYPSGWPVVDVLAPIGIFVLCLGVLFVSMTWALEGMSYLTVKPSRCHRLAFAREVLEKPHLVQMALQLPWDLGKPIHPTFSSLTPAPGAADIKGFINPLGAVNATGYAEQVRWRRLGLSSRWGQSLLIGGASLGFLTGHAVGGPWYLPWVGAIVGGLAAAMAAPTALVSQFPNVGLRILLVGLLIGLGAALQWKFNPHLDRILLVVALFGWLSLFMVFAMFMSASNRSLVTFVAGMKRGLVGVAHSALAFFIGRAAMTEGRFNVEHGLDSGEHVAQPWPHEVELTVQKAADQPSQTAMVGR